MKSILTVEQLSVVLQNKQILNNVNLHLERGEILGLVGPSGCGKTTLLNTIAGFTDLAEGAITIEQQTITPKHQVPAEKRKVGVIFQDYALFPHLTINQNIAFGIQKLPKAEQKERVEGLLNMLSLSEFGERYPHQLSGGQQQRVAIARALAVQPRLLLLDEPFSNIDARLRDELMVELRRLLKSLNMSAIFVTHNKDEVFSFADKIALLHHGRIIQTGVPKVVFEQPETWQVADFLQVGSWLKVVKEQHKVKSALGEIPIAPESIVEQSMLLVKPKMLQLANNEANSVVTHVAYTEQGYKYTLASLDRKSPMAFEQLHFYSDQLMSVNQQVSIHIIAHEYQIYTKSPIEN